MYIVGVASDKTEAFEVVRSIIEDVYLHTGGFDVRGYLGITDSIEVLVCYISFC